MLDTMMKTGFMVSRNNQYICMMLQAMLLGLQITDMMQTGYI